MNIQEYIDSGKLVDYCLGVLSDNDRIEVENACLHYPSLKAELTRIEKTFGQYAAEFALTPPHRLEDKIWNTLENVNKEQRMNFDDLPVINQFTDHANWSRFVAPMIPDNVTSGRMSVLLRFEPTIMQALVVSQMDFEAEIHTDINESFIILQGECECTFGTNVFKLGPGGFAEVPLHTSHSVKMLSPYVVAVLQRVAV